MTDVIHYRYLTVISDAPLMILRVPMKPKPTKGLPNQLVIVPRWRDMLRALTPVMRSHGKRLKDLYALDHLFHPDDVDGATDPSSPHKTPAMIDQALQTRTRLEQAYKGEETRYAAFLLYEWVPEGGGSFTLVQAAKLVLPTDLGELEALVKETWKGKGEPQAGA